MCFSILVAELDEGLLLSGALARRLGLGADAGDDLARLLEDRVAVEVVEVPAGRARLFGELACLLVERRERVAEEDAARALGRALSAAEGGAREAAQARLQLRVGLQQRLVLEVHVLDGGLACPRRRG